MKKKGVDWFCSCGRYWLSFDGYVIAMQGDECVPLQVQGLSDIVAIDAGYTHNLALKRDGTVWAWGNKESLWTFYTPVQILKNFDDIIAIEANGDESRVYTAYGLVYE